MKRLLFVASVVLMVVTIVLLAFAGPVAAQGRGGFGRGGGFGGSFSRGHGGFGYGYSGFGYSHTFCTPASQLLIQPLYAPQQLLVQPIYAQPVLAPVLVAPVYASPLSVIQAQVLTEVQVYAPFVRSYDHLGAYCQTPGYGRLPLEVRNRVGQHFPGVGRGRR